MASIPRTQQNFLQLALQRLKVPTLPRPPPTPLLDIEDVRAFVRSALGLPQIPAHRRLASSSHKDPDHPHHHSPTSSSVFDIGTVGPSLSEAKADGSRSPEDSQEESVSSAPSLNLHDGQFPYYRPSSFPAPNFQFSPQEHRIQPPLLDIEDVREAVEKVLQVCGRIQRFGRPETSWQNKMPWHVPRAPFLARGLQWPPESFDSEEQRKEFYRKARKRKPFLMGSPPIWSVTAFNVAFLYVLIFNPISAFFNRYFRD